MLIKPWVVPKAKWKNLMHRDTLLTQFGKSICIAKPSENLYLGEPIGALSGISASIVNLAGHGEMSVDEILANEQVGIADSRLINLLPTKIRLGSALVGERKGRFLNHFGYRKQVMSFFPQSLLDHAWIACALSYSQSVNDEVPFDIRGGGMAGGIAGITKNGAIFRGSAVADTEGILVSPMDSLHVSMAANAETELVETCECSLSEFFNHEFINLLESSKKL